MDIMLIVTLAILGAFFGSFAVAQVWRLRALQLVEDERDGEPIDKKELSRLRGLLRPPHKDRSECLSCHHNLAWYDLVPLFSWLYLGGRCRYCKSPIGYTEILTEIGLAGVFAVSYLAWPYSLESFGSLVPFVFWLTGCVVGAILLIYDAKWSLLPFKLNIAFIGVGILYVLALSTIGGQSIDIVSLLLGVALLGGLYLVFSLFGWVGMGDGILGVGLALFLGSWQLAFLALFLANLLGCLMMIPLYLRGKLHRNARIPFGPFLIAASLVCFLVGNYIISQAFGLTDALTNLLML